MRELLPAALVFLAATVVVTFAVRVFQRKPQPIGTTIVPIEPITPAPGVIARPVPPPENVKVPVAPPDTGVTKSVRPARRAPPRPKTRRAPPEPPPPEPSPDALYANIVRRARALQRRAPERQQAIDNLVADATLWHRAANVSRARKELRRISTALSDLEP